MGDRGGSSVVWAGKPSCDDHLEAARPEGQSLAAGGHCFGKDFQGYENIFLGVTKFFH